MLRSFPTVFLLSCIIATILLSPNISGLVLLQEKFPYGDLLPLNKERDPYLHEETVDPAGKYRLQWYVDWQYNRIVFNVTVETLGFIQFGITKQIDKSKADVVLGGVYQNGKPYFSDSFIVDGGAPRKDIKQDWILHNSWQSQTHTFLSFSRLLDTCDEYDIPLDNDDTVIVLWGYGYTDDLGEYPFATRGSAFHHLKDPDFTPTPVLNKFYSPSWDPAFLGADVKVWTIRNEFQIPQKRTTYWCRIHKLSLPRKSHIIGFTFKVDNVTHENMHHALLYRCIVDNPDSVFKQFLDHPGEECYTQNMQLGEIPFTSCLELKVGYAIGGRPLFFPNDVGVPIGGTSRNEYYLLQTHYDNPTGRTDLVSENQLNIYYTSRLRKNDGGIFSLGHNLPGTPSLLLPPRTTDHRIIGQCSSACSKKILPQEGIKLSGIILHSHNAGQKLTLQQFRDNVELPPVLQDNSYVINHQPFRLLRKEVTVLPGDLVAMRCEYDTTYENRTIIGGFGVDQEMCLAFILYYNVLEDYPLCRSQLISSAYLAKYFAGTTNVTWNQPRIEFEATAPPQVAGKVLTEISDTLVDWNTNLRAQLKRDHLIHPQVEICPNYKEIIASSQPGVPLPPPTFVNYPVEADEYQAPPRCALQN